MSHLTESAIQPSTKHSFTINGDPIISAVQLEQTLDNLLRHNDSSLAQTQNATASEKHQDERCQETSLCEKQDDAHLRIKFIERISQIANGSDLRDTLPSGARRLTCTADSSTLEIQYFPTGTAMIGWVDTTMGLIYYYINNYENWCTAKRIDSYQKQNGKHTDICPEKEMFCQSKETLRDILFYFYETGERYQKYHWIEDFSYTGSGGWHKDWMKNSLKRLTIPEEQDEAFKKRRKAQESGQWQWGIPWQRQDYWRGAVCWENPEEMAQLEQLTCLEASDATALTEPLPDFPSPDQQEHDILMRQTAARLMKEKAFTQRASGIRDLCFLQNCGHLRKLDLRCNDVEDLSALASLRQLKELTLDYNLISDLSALEGLEQLRQLWLMGNKVRSLEPLRGLHNLNALHLRGNPLAPGTLASLRKCKRLGTLDLSHTGIQDISDLEYCRVWSLHLYGNPGVTGLEVIATMKNLTCLDLDWETARRYDIPALAPRLTEHARYGDHVEYVWPQKYFDE